MTDYIRCFACQGTGDAHKKPDAITDDNIIYEFYFRCIYCDGDGSVRAAHLKMDGGRK